MLLKSLRELTIAKSNRNNVCEITFDGGIVPVLKAVGGSLNLLKLRGLDMYMDLTAIDYFCSNLCHLFLKSNLDYMLVQLRTRSMFKKLETMHLASNETPSRWVPEDVEPIHVISHNILLLLLSSPVLKDVSIEGCYNLRDDLVQQAYNIHGFENLEQLGIYSCKSLTNEGFGVFMKVISNPLKTITFGDCDLLTMEYLVELHKKINENKWKVMLQEIPAQAFI